MKIATINSSHNLLRFQVYRWSIYLILVVSYILVFFHRMVPAAVSSDLMRTFHTTGATLGSLAAMYYYIYTVMQIPAGIMSDTIGSRSISTMGNLVAGIGSIIFGVAGDIEMAYIGRFLVGFGVSVIFVGLMKSNTLWFKDNVYALISGLTILLGNLGSVLSAAPIVLLLEIISWREIFISIGMFSIFLGTISFFVVKNKPEDIGISFDNTENKLFKSSSVTRNWKQDLYQLLKNKYIWSGFWLNFGMTGGLFSFVGLWGIPFLKDVYSLNLKQAANYTTIALISISIGVLLFGWLSDYIKRRKPLLILGAACYLIVCAAFLFLNINSEIERMLIFAAFGLSGSSFVLTYPAAKEVSFPHVSGMSISVVNTGLFLGAAVMQTLFGWILDLSWTGLIQHGVRIYNLHDYHHSFYAMIAFAVIAVSASITIKETNAKNISLEIENEHDCRS